MSGRLAHSWLRRGDEIIMSAVAVLHAIGTFQTAPIRSRALTSGSCGWGSSGSQKKMSASIRPSAIIAPIC